MTNICWECIEDQSLREIVRGESVLEQCAECNEIAQTVSVERLGQLIANVFREHFEIGEEVKLFDGADDDRGYYHQQGEELSDVLQELTGQCFSFQDELVAAVCDTDDYWPPDGGEPFFDASYCYQRIKIARKEYKNRWKEIHAGLLHKQRFFNKEAEALFSDLFGEINTLKSWNETAGTLTDPAILDLPENSRIYRARAAESNSLLLKIVENPLANVGPPPAESAKAGRMNAEGVCILYGARELSTCLAEMRPPIGGQTAVIQLQTTSQLRLLDFSRLETAYSGGGLSFFHENFAHEADKQSFLRRLHELISRPVTPGNESDYMITQTMTEFLAYRLDPKIDGFLFRSAQSEEGQNIVLFPHSRMNIFPVEYVPDTLEFFRTKTIDYKHDALEPFIHRDVVYLQSEHDYYEPDGDY